MSLQHNEGKVANSQLSVGPVGQRALLLCLYRVVYGSQRPKDSQERVTISNIKADGFKTRFSVLYLLPHSHQFLNIRPLNISCDDCITGMWRIYKLVDLPNLVDFH